MKGKTGVYIRTIQSELDVPTELFCFYAIVDSYTNTYVDGPDEIRREFSFKQES